MTTDLMTLEGQSEYEGIRLETDNPSKLIPFIDQLLFWLRVEGRKAHPVTIREGEGVMEIVWKGRKPKPLRDRLVLCNANGEHIDLFQVSAAA